MAGGAEIHMTGKRKTWETDQACLVCGTRGAGLVTMHHEMTRKAYPELSDDSRNLLALCSTHHTMRHAIGQSSFCHRFPQYVQALKSNGFQFCELKNTWRLNA